MRNYPLRKAIKKAGKELGKVCGDSREILGYSAFERNCYNYTKRLIASGSIREDEIMSGGTYQIPPEKLDQFVRYFVLCYYEDKVDLGEIRNKASTLIDELTSISKHLSPDDKMAEKLDKLEKNTSEILDMLQQHTNPQTLFGLGE
ncbi:MAG: hypothetical protein ACOCRO_06455 [Halanaerobiales bacterium]